jgi:hypothetical protein
MPTSAKAWNSKAIAFIYLRERAFRVLIQRGRVCHRSRFLAHLLKSEELGWA